MLSPAASVTPRGPAIALVAVVLTGATSAAAPAASLRCGTVVGERAVLDHDLRCPGPALILRNPRTVLQLNGHTIESSRSCSEGAAPTGIGVESTADGAQILGPGLIRGFRTGIAIGGAARVQVRDLRISDNCTDGLLVVDANDVRVRNLIAHRNGSSAVRVESAERFGLAASEVFLNGAGAESSGAAVDLRHCVDCRVTANRITNNRGVGLRLDVESHGNYVERNVVFDHRAQDVVDEGADNTFVLNAFERGGGVLPPALWPLIGDAGPTAPGVAGCGVMDTFLKPRETVTVTCPQDPGLRALRNSVVAYRLLLGGTTRHGQVCEAAEILPASSSGGGAVRCTNPDSLWGLVLEVTCCLN